MPRLVAMLLLLLCLIARGSGLLEYWHNAEHAQEDARLAAAAKAAGQPVDEHPDHNDSNCAVHAQLHLALFVVAWALFFLCLGLLPQFILPNSSRLNAQRALVCIACRGPPTFA